MGSTTVNKVSDTANKQVKDYYMSKFNKVKLTDFTVTEKSFGESSNRFRREESLF